MRELQFVRSGRLAWAEKPDPQLIDSSDAIVRPFVVSRCDGDTLPLHRPVSRALQFGMAVGVVDPVVGCICGKVPFKGPFGIGHECVAEVVEVGPDVQNLRPGQIVVVPWAVSCGTCHNCQLGLTSKCTTTTDKTLAAFGFGPSSGNWGGMIADRFRVPYADHMLVPVPAGTDPLRVAAASDNLADAWRSVVPGLESRPGGTVLVLGGGAKSIGLFAAGLAVAKGASTVDYLDDDAGRRRIAEAMGARAQALSGRRKLRNIGASARRYDVVIEATSNAPGLRMAIGSLAPGGTCTAVGYYLATGTRLPLMKMYATDATLKVGVSHARAALPEMLEFVDRAQFPAESVTTITADWEDAPRVYADRTTKLVLRRDRLDTFDFKR